jgi:hypothetical protein
MTSLGVRRGREMRVRGISVLEFTGCFAALVGGVFLGSMYLGVNVKELAYTALERGHIIETRRPAQSSTAASDAQLAAANAAGTPAAEAFAAEAAASGAVASAATVATAPTSIAPAPVQPAPKPAEPAPAAVPASATTTPAEAAPATTTDAPAAPASPTAPIAGLFAREDLITDQQREALTKAYWEALAACMQDEVKNRVPAIDAEGNWQLFDYLTGRKEGHLKAAAAIAALDPRGVDDHVLAYSKKCRSWHEDGGKLFSRAVDLLTDAPTAHLSGPFAQSWQSAATQHRMEARLLVEKRQAVQSYLDHAYQGEAAPAAK